LLSGLFLAGCGSSDRPPAVRAAAVESTTSLSPTTTTAGTAPTSVAMTTTTTAADRPRWTQRVSYANGHEVIAPPPQSAQPQRTATEVLAAVQRPPYGFPGARSTDIGFALVARDLGVNGWATPKPMWAVVSHGEWAGSMSNTPGPTDRVFLVDDATLTPVGGDFFGGGPDR
jgi:hypothetical protein